MTDIYDQHKVAFANVAAYVVMKDGDRVATVAFKYPRDGAGRLYAYVHVIGLRMVRGFAGGYGYDKHSAAVENAVAKMGDYMAGTARGELMHAILTGGDGIYWYDRLRKAGFDVWQAV
jgi:hypothetical protein